MNITNTQREHCEIIYIDKDTKNKVTVFIPSKTEALICSRNLRNLGHKLLSRARVLEKESITRKVTVTNF